MTAEAGVGDTTPPTIDVDRLARWLDTADTPGARAPLTATYISGGSQNEIYEIRRGDLHAALRIPPLAAPASRDDGILREWRIIEALDGTDVPHTTAIAVCPDPATTRPPAPATSTCGACPDPMSCSTTTATSPGARWTTSTTSALTAIFRWGARPPLGVRGLF